MSAGVITGLAGIVSVSDGASNAQAAFTNATMINVPFGDVNMIEYTTLGQADRYIKKIEGMINPGNFSFEFLYLGTDYSRCVALKGVEKTWVVTIPTDGVASKTVTMTGTLIKADLELKNGELVSVKVEVSISGAIVVA
jgi:hypothetical protein